MINQGVKARGVAIKEILAISIRDELAESYDLDLSEMYSIIDYISELEEEVSRLGAELRHSKTFLMSRL